MLSLTPRFWFYSNLCYKYPSLISAPDLYRTIVTDIFNTRIRNKIELHMFYLRFLELVVYVDQNKNKYLENALENKHYESLPQPMYLIIFISNKDVHIFITKIYSQCFFCFTQSFVLIHLQCCLFNTAQPNAQVNEFLVQLYFQQLLTLVELI